MARPRKSLAKPTQVPSPSVQITPRVLNQREAAIYIGSSVYAVERLWADGTIPSYMQSGRRVCDRLELDKFVERRKAEPPTRLSARAQNLGVA